MLVRLFAIVLCFFCAAISVYAKEIEYIVGVEDVSYYPLFDFSPNDTNRPSFTRDLLTTFFESHQLPYRFVALPIKRFDKWFIEQNIDFKFPDNDRWREDKEYTLNIVFSQPVIQLKGGTYVLKKNSNFTSDKVRKLATITGFHPTLWLNEVKNKQVILYQESSPLSIVRHLLRENTDATNIDKNVINYQLKKLHKENTVVLAKNITHQNYYYHFSSIKYPAIIELFNKFLADNQKYIESLKQKYHIVE